MTLITILGGLLISFVVGTLTGVFGVGGGFLMTPCLIIFLGIAGPTAVGTDLAIILVNSTYGVIRRRNTGTLDLKLALTIALGSVVGMAGGLYVLETLKTVDPLVIYSHQVPAVEFILLCSFILLLSGIAGFLFIDYYRLSGQAPAKRVGILSKVRMFPYGYYSSLEEPKLSVIPLVLMGIMVGLLTGLIGIGGGVLWLPLLIYLVGQRAVKAAGTSLILVWIVSFFAVMLNYKCGNINFSLLGIMLTGGICGTYIGTRISLNSTGPKLRLYFIYVLIIAIMLISYNVFQMTFGHR